jgi:hypothetical protein
MIRTILTSAFCVFFTAIAVPATAHAAESDGAAGVVNRVHISTPSSPSYSNNHAYVLIGSDYYYSGGSDCTGVDELTSADLDRLTVTLVNGLTVNPWYTTVGSTRCLTTYMLYAP